MFRRLFTVWIALWLCIAVTYSFAETVHNDEIKGYTLSTSQLYLFSSLDSNNHQGLKDGDGNIVLPAEYYIQETNLSFIVTLDETNGKRGYIDKLSGFYMPPQFDSV